MSDQQVKMITLRIPLKSKSKSFQKALNLLENYSLKNNGIVNECEVNFNDDTIKEIIILLSKLKGVAISYQDKQVDVKTLTSVLTCPFECTGTCLNLEGTASVLHPDIMNCFDRVKGGVGHLYDDQLHFFGDSLTKLAEDEYMLEKDRLKEVVIEGNWIIFEFCPRANLKKTLGLLNRIPTRFKVLFYEPSAPIEVVREENLEVKQQLREILIQSRDLFTQGNFNKVIQQAQTFSELLKEYDGTKIVFSNEQEITMDLKQFINKMQFHFQSPIESISGSQEVKDTFRSFNLLDVMRRSFVYGIAPQDSGLYVYDFYNSSTKKKALEFLEQKGFEFLPISQCRTIDKRHWLKKILGIKQPTLEKFIAYGVNSLEEFRQLTEDQLKELSKTKGTRERWVRRSKKPFNLWNDIIREERNLADFYQAQKANEEVIWKISYNNYDLPCPVCRALEGKKFPSGSVPQRPHFDCQCRIFSEEEYQQHEPARNHFLLVEEAQEIVRQKEGTHLQDMYDTDGYTKWKMRCKEGHTWSIKPADIVQGRWCPKCSKIKK